MASLGPQLLCIWGLVLGLELDVLSRPLSQTLVTWEDELGLCSWFVLLSLPRSSWTHNEQAKVRASALGIQHLSALQSDKQ